MNTFAILAEPNRRRLLDALVGGPRSVNELVEVIGMSQPVVSKHLKVLRDAGLVTVAPEGQRRMYHLSPEPLGELDEWLAPYRAVWADRLDAVADLLHRTHNHTGESE